MSAEPWRVLLVDDDPLILELLTLRLQAKGYAVDTATDGAQAYAVFKAFQPHLVICDVLMPHVDGPAFCRRLREEKITVPFLFLTAKGQARDKIEAFSAGGDDHMIKPFDPGELFARLAAILRRYYPDRL